MFNVSRNLCKCITTGNLRPKDIRDTTQPHDNRLSLNFVILVYQQNYFTRTKKKNYFEQGTETKIVCWWSNVAKLIAVQNNRRTQVWIICGQRGSITKTVETKNAHAM